MAEQYENPESAQLRSRIESAFAKTDNAVVVKTQTGRSGRIFFLPLMALLATAIYGICVYCMGWINLELRILGLVVGTLVYLFFLLRFGLCFFVDVKTAKHAETIAYLQEDGARYVFSKGLYTDKFEYAGGFLAFWGGKAHDKNYETFSDKTKYSPLASSYDRHLQRRSSNYRVLSAEFWTEQLYKGSFTVGDTFITAQNGDGAFRIDFDGEGRLARLQATGDATFFYDSGSPVHIYDAKVPFSYSFTYTFTQVNAADFDIVLAPIAKQAMKDYLMQPIPSQKVTVR